jgi:hypothetical protein
MAIKNYDEESFFEKLAELFSPSQEINREERLVGREKALTSIRRALFSPGRQIFIFGDRGVGKSSVAMTAAYLHNNSSTDPIRINCGKDTSFSQVFSSILTYDESAEGRIERKSNQFKLGAQAAGYGGNVEIASEKQRKSYRITTVQDAIDVLNLVDTKDGRRINVIDEFDRITDPREQNKFAEMIKSASSIDVDVRFIFCGIGQTIDDIMGAHESTGRYLEPISLERLPHNHLHDIVTNASSEFGITISDEILFRVGIISDGFPHYVHLIGQQLLSNAFDEEFLVSKIEYKHFKDALNAAIEKSEPTLKLGYQKATEKTKNKEQYEIALWSLADKSETRRQVTKIFEESTTGIVVQSDYSKDFDKKILNSRLLLLRDERHGSVVVGHGAGWFSFRENVFRGYVRMKAEAQGVRLRLQD